MPKTLLVPIFILLALVGFLAGCGKKTAADVQVFNQAAPEIKAIWEKSQAADKANDYYNATAGYMALMNQRDKLTDAQAQVVNASMVVVGQRMAAAIKNGDAAAKAAAAKLYQSQTGRPR